MKFLLTENSAVDDDSQHLWYPVVSAFRRTVTVRLKPDTTNEERTTNEKRTMNEKDHGRRRPVNRPGGGGVLLK
jgi:hypothetical protein